MMILANDLGLQQLVKEKKKIGAADSSQTAFILLRLETAIAMLLRSRSDYCASKSFFDFCPSSFTLTIFVKICTLYDYHMAKCYYY